MNNVNGQWTCAHLLFFLWSTLWAFFPFFFFLVWFFCYLCTGEVSKLSHCSRPLACLETWYTSVMEHSHCLPLTLSFTHTVFICSHSLLNATSVTEHSHGLALSYAVILYLTLHQWLNTHTISHGLMQLLYTWHYISDWTLTLALQSFSYICAVAYNKSMTGSSMMMLVSRDSEEEEDKEWLTLPTSWAIFPLCIQ